MTLGDRILKRLKDGAAYEIDLVLSIRNAKRPAIHAELEQLLVKGLVRNREVSRDGRNPRLMWELIA